LIILPKAGARLDKEPGHRSRRTLKTYKSLGGLQVVQLAAGENVEHALERYRASGLVEFAEPDYKLYATTLPNDPQFSNGTQWALRNGSSGRDIHAVAAWDTLSTASNIVVAVIDSGIRYTHEDLAANMWVNVDEIPDNGIDDDKNGTIDDIHGINLVHRNGDPMDDGNHGTHVAGVIAAVGNNGRGISGVAWKAKLMACKFLDSNGEGDTSDAIDAIDYARSMGAQVINASFGGPDYSAALFTAIQTARNAGVILVAAAGNEIMDTDLTPIYPACYALDNIVVVGGTSRSDAIDLGYSNWGSSSVDLFAPGSSIYSTWGTSDTAYQTLSGTSMATPHVAGALALMKARFPNLTSSQIISRLHASVDVLPDLADRCRTGGRLNLAKALGPDPAADFAASIWIGQPPLTVTFTNLSLGELRSVFWDFGDGATSTVLQPTHIFDTVGDFNVQLTVIGTNSKTNTLTKTIRVLPNYTFSPETYAWIDPSGMTRITLTDNGVSPAQSLPFSFYFYGEPKTSVYVAANGILGFTADGMGTTENLAMPNAAAPNGLIAPHWDNLNPAAGGYVAVGTVGTAPDRRFVVSWVNVPRVSTTALLSFQAILEESTGSIVYQYRDIDGTRGSGRGATVGLENLQGDLAALYSHNGSPYLLANRTALRASLQSYSQLELVSTITNLFSGGLGGPFAPSNITVQLRNSGNAPLNWSATPEAAWLESTPSSGSLARGETTEVLISVSTNANQLSAGLHNSAVAFQNTSVPSTRSLRQLLQLQVNSRLSPTAVVQNGVFRAELSATQAGSYSVEFSTDLVTWSPLATVMAQNGSVQFDDIVSSTGQRFYRLRLL
jgi:PKD repeat protein